MSDSEESLDDVTSSSKQVSKKSSPRASALEAVPGEKQRRFRRPRNHVNPLSRFFQTPIALPTSWIEEAFQNPGQAFHVDIGCGYGRYCIDMAQEFPTRNVLGLEIRKPIVDHINENKPQSESVSESETQ
eukprot:Selendium_serpulae@DN1317_c0_g1_i1.p1